MFNYLLIINLISFGMCYNDKYRAKMRKFRIPERVMIGISCMGGAFGFWTSMYFFHHKTKHLKFIILEPLFITIWVLIILIERGII